MPFGSILRRLPLVILSGALLAAQGSPQTNSAPLAPSNAPPPVSAQSNDELSQIQNDLNRMESLNTNMSTEIEFLHDQNLQILLRTNSQMWTILIRDMRRQLQQEEQRRSTTPATPKR